MFEMAEQIGRLDLSETFIARNGILLDGWLSRF